ncbi:peptidoglycan-binding protein [Streptomyces sp. NPDC087212]|uniref:peptidoglycan-binding protein n=1 Tax=Streptomyces sp. NPDC087212 TaxID=3365766 RepID=UPI00382C5F79
MPVGVVPGSTGLTAPIPVIPATPTPTPPPPRTEETLALGTISPAATPSSPAQSEPERRRRRRALLLSAGGAVITVAMAAALVSGVLSYESPSRDGVRADDVRARVPDTATHSPSTSPSVTPTTPSAEPSATPARPSPTRSPSASASAPSASPTPSTSRSARPSGTPSSSSTPGAPNQGTASPGQSAAPVLEPGDDGDEVTELQLRLRQLNLYDDDIDGDYDTQVESSVRNYQWARGITTDELGVYGATTRARLESETSQP